MSAGLEHHVYFVDEYLKDQPTVHLKKNRAEGFSCNGFLKIQNAGDDIIK